MENEEMKKIELDESDSNEDNGSSSEETTIVSGIMPGMIEREITNEVKTAFLSYAMSVIEARAIPDVRDGLKPVQRRIIYGMDESGMQPSKPHKKCARIVGDVMGKYHPHGDSAIYSTLVRLAQPFSMRYTLVDGHGNFGSIDGDEAAAMRYTEARMAKIALEMVRGLDEDTVDFQDNYDGTEKEPVVLPSRIPNLLINGSEGIAVGMATNMPPHNLAEVINAIVALAKNPEITVDEIIRDYLHGPDFPTGGIILGRQGIRDAYTTGTGTIPIRSRYSIEDLPGGRSQIIVTEIPYQVNKSKMVEGIANLVKDKLIEGISDIRDESNREGIRVVIEVKRDAIPEVVINNLLKHSQLQVNFGVINLCLVNGEPKVLPIIPLLQNYIDFQVEVLTRRTNSRLKRDTDRDHIVLGLILAHDNIDEVIHIIRSSQNDEESARKLHERFDLTSEQSAAILAMTLRRLQGLEQEKLQVEHNELSANIIEYKRLLSSKDNIIDLMIQELNEIRDKYGDKRLTEISDQEANIDSEDLIPEEDIVVVLTRNGYLKRMNDQTFRSQNRGGRGVKGISTTAGDMVRIMLHTKTHTDLLFFSSLGFVYRLRGYAVPDGAREGKGIPAVNLLKLEKDEKIVSIVPLDEYPEEDYLFFATTNGIVKRTPLKEFASIHSNGKRALTLKDDDSLLDVKHTNGQAIVSLASSNGKVCSFYENDVRAMGRSAAGVRGMNLDDGSHLVDITTSLEGDKILVLTDLGYGKISYAKDTEVTAADGSVRHYDGYRLTSRGAKGVLSLKMGKKNGELAAMRAVNGDEDLMVITTHGIVLRTHLSQVKVAGRNTQGVKIINLEPRQKVASLTIVPFSEEVDGESQETVEAEIIEDTDPVIKDEEIVTPDDID